MAKKNDETKVLSEPRTVIAQTEPGSRAFEVVVRSLIGDATLTVTAANALAAKQRVIDDFARGVSVRGE